MTGEWKRSLSVLCRLFPLFTYTKHVAIFVHFLALGTSAIMILLLYALVLNFFLHYDSSLVANLYALKIHLYRYLLHQKSTVYVCNIIENQNWCNE